MGTVASKSSRQIVRGREGRINIPVTLEEQASYHRIAKESGKSMSSWVRDLLAVAVEKRRAGIQLKKERTSITKIAAKKRAARLAPGQELLRLKPAENTCNGREHVA